ncbi:MAG: hypothetical protein WCJ01_01745 [Ignavibacteria bacterium]
MKTHKTRCFTTQRVFFAFSHLMKVQLLPTGHGVQSIFLSSGTPDYTLTHFKTDRYDYDYGCE